MNQQLQTILNFIQQSEQIGTEEKAALLKSISDLNKELEITNFKLDRTEKVKKTTAILLEETIQELEQKRKAVEVQNRELEIESSLERVRSKAMAMQKSEDLANAVAIVFEELDKLNLGMLRCGIGILDKEKRSVDVWTTTKSEGETRVQVSGDESMDIHPLLQGAFDAWLQKKEDYSYVLQGEDLSRFYNALTKTNFKLPESQSIQFASEDIRQFYYTVPFQAGALYAFRETDFPDEAKKVMKRFAEVFNLTYTRFNDLKQAEAQAREAKIEAALERVRSRTMGMQRSDELPQAANLLFQQIQGLGMPAWSAGYCIWDDDKKGITLWMSSEGVLQPPFRAPLTEDSSFIHMRERHDAGESFYAEAIGGEELRKHYQYMRTLPVVGQILDSIIEAGHPLPTFQIFHVAYFSRGFLLFITYEPVPEAHDVFKRFSKVFDQTYTRFLDLKKAEEQTREAQIELGLERVRARAMAMQNSIELNELIGTVFIELTKLDLVLTRCLIMIYDPETKDSRWWMANSEAPDQPMNFLVKYHKLPPYMAYVKAWEDRMLRWNFTLEGKDKEAWDDFLFVETELSLLPDFVIAGMKAPDRVYLNASFNNFGNLTLATLDPLSSEHFEILLRFAKVFDLTYTRFNDLKNAEAQGREAKIEASLERVRSKAMAMHNSEDLAATIAVFYRELQAFSITPRRCGVGLLNKETRVAELSTMNTTEHGDSIEIIGQIKMENHPVLEKVFDNWLLQKEYHPILRGKEIKEYYQLLRPQIDFPEYPNDAVQYGHFFFFPEGGVYAWTEKELAEDELKIYRRFTSVLSLTYRRYKDLKEAEAQAKEAQIEVCLERVRAKAMAMHSSEDLAETIKVFYQQMEFLGIPARRCGVGLIDKETHTADITSMNLTEEGKIKEITGKLNLTNHPVLEKVYDNWLSKEEYHPVLRGKEITDYYQVIGSQISFQNYPHDAVQFGYFFFFTEGTVFVWTEKEFSDNELKLYRRFSSVLNLTYKRYIDLKTAEAQARESQIEVALERIRAKTMAMYKSEQLSETARVVFEQFDLLGKFPDRMSIGIIREESKSIEILVTDQSNSKLDYALVASVNEPTTLSKLYEAWKQKKDSIIINLTGKDLQNWIRYVRTELKIPVDEAQIKDRRVHQGAFFSQGMLLFTTHEPVSGETMNLLIRFARVFDQTYTRFLDLKKAEAQARESNIETALERVRAKVMSMSTSNDLKATSLVFGDQLKNLGTEWAFSYFWLIEEDKDCHTFWITWPDNNTSVTSYPLAEADQFTLDCLAAWRNGTKIHSNYVRLEDLPVFLETFKQLAVDAGGAAVEVMQAENFSNGVFYYDAMMKYGSFGVCMNRPATEEENKIQCRFAIEFERAYTRFLDLKQAEHLAEQSELDLIKLKEEKKRSETALRELKAAQSQLIQSEKMASLGELTAGIAHEIQNPLNFINNFSEVNKELLLELKEEIEKRNMEEIQAIATDIIKNEEKINHHGKRADAIVKGMLQHSRTSNAIKEPTDINKLADEYLRLAYHGLRAKDKTFNAIIKTNFDDSIGQINIIPQDIGRVLLNLYNNAFYAVAEKSKQQSDGYQPTVLISTKQIKDQIEVTVKDNGDGIPENVLNKIFQPFFTTKPTGQGTGLGLSLSYDIIKSHGGEIKVKTKVEGTVFTIHLPVTSNQ